VEKTSRLRSRDPVASRVKCGPHGGMNNMMQSWTVSWSSLKTKVEPGLRGSQVMSGDWRRLHRVRGVCSGSPKNHWVTRLSTKPRPKTRRGGVATQAGSTAQEGRSDRLGRSDCPGWSNHPGGRSDRPGRWRRDASKRRTRVRIARLASRLCRLQSPGIRPMKKI
jgi:hypothetical protein